MNVVLVVILVLLLFGGLGGYHFQGWNYGGPYIGGGLGLVLLILLILALVGRL